MEQLSLRWSDIYNQCTAFAPSNHQKQFFFRLTGISHACISLLPLLITLFPLNLITSSSPVYINYYYKLRTCRNSTGFNNFLEKNRENLRGMTATATNHGSQRSNKWRWQDNELKKVCREMERRKRHRQGQGGDTNTIPTFPLPAVNVVLMGTPVHLQLFPSISIDFFFSSQMLQ